MVGWHHCLGGCEFDQALGGREGQGGLACCSPRAHRESGRTERLDSSSSEHHQALDVCRVLVSPAGPPALALRPRPSGGLGILRPTCHPFCWAALGPLELPCLFATEIEAPGVCGPLQTIRPQPVAKPSWVRAAEPSSLALSKDEPHPAHNLHFRAPTPPHGSQKGDI